MEVNDEGEVGRKIRWKKGTEEQLKMSGNEVLDSEKNMEKSR
jgi:hypothetical protein